MLIQVTVIKFRSQDELAFSSLKCFDKVFHIIIIIIITLLLLFCKTDTAFQLLSNVLVTIFVCTTVPPDEEKHLDHLWIRALSLPFSGNHWKCENGQDWAVLGDWFGPSQAASCCLCFEEFLTWVLLGTVHQALGCGAYSLPPCSQCFCLWQNISMEILR